MSQTIIRKLETALVNMYLAPTSPLSSSIIIDTSNNPARWINLYTGEENKDKDAPAIICNVNRAVEEIPYSSVWRVSTEIDVKEVAVEVDQEDVSVLADAAFQTLLTPSSSLASGNGLNIMGIVITNQDLVFSGDCWVAKLTVDIIASG